MDYLNELQKATMMDLNEKFLEATIQDEISVFEKTPLYIAVENKNIEVIQLLFLLGEINVNEKSFYFHGNNQIQEKTPLHLAVEKEYIEIIKILLEHKNIDVNIEDEQGKKPIDYKSNNEIKKILNH